MNTNCDIPFTFNEIITDFDSFQMFALINAHFIDRKI
jgi:hypothetical protein